MDGWFQTWVNKQSPLPSLGASFDSLPWDWLGWFVDVYLEPAGDEGTNSFTPTKKENFYWSPLIDSWVETWEIGRNLSTAKIGSWSLTHSYLLSPHLIFHNSESVYSFYFYLPLCLLLGYGLCARPTLNMYIYKHLVSAVGIPQTWYQLGFLYHLSPLQQP